MNGDHFTFAQLQDYAAKRLPPEQIPAFHAHIDSWQLCAELLSALASGAGADHLAEQQAVDYVAGRLTSGDQARLAAHLQTCESCEAMVADLQDFRREQLSPRQMPAPPSARRTLAWALPLAAALCLAAGISALLVERAGKSGPAASAQLRDAGGFFRLSASGALVADATPPPGTAKLIAAALKAGHLPDGPLPLVDAARQEDSLRGLPTGPAQPEAGAFSPSGVFVLSDRPEFRWSPPEGATAYRVSIADDSLKEIATSGTIHAPVWTPEVALPRGRPMVWQVAVLRNGAWTTSPAPPKASPRFEIAAEEEARGIAQAQAANPPSHLLLAILYTKAGLAKEANAELDAIVALNPGSALAASLRGTR